MTTQEFSDAFDVLLNSYNTAGSFGEDHARQDIVLDEYEKSLFLTKAQEDLVLSLYTGKNSMGESFESTEEMRRYLSNLVKTYRCLPITNSSGMTLSMSDSSTYFSLPTDLWFITYESIQLLAGSCKNETNMRVYPIKQDEYQSIRDNPFRGVNGRRALRLDLSEGNVEIISNNRPRCYDIRYIKKVPPIILVNLPQGLSINNESKEMGCTLHEALHQKILDRAVILALQSKVRETRTEG